MSTAAANELDTLTVHGETSVGWCAQTAPNEIVDEDGRRLRADERRPGIADPRSPGRRAQDDPEVVALRDHLHQHNGLHGLEICDPSEVERATRIFRRDGFVVVRDLLDEEKLARFREGCARVLREILEVPGVDGRKYLNESGRLPHRYSYGACSASRQLLHDPVWASMVDLPTTTPILTEIFGGKPDYVVMGAGGDLCLPGAIEYQHLHSDGREMSPVPKSRIEQAQRLGIELNEREGSDELDTQTQRMIIEATPPVVTINFLVSDLTWENGPIRQIPGTHAASFPPPSPEDEPEWMRLSTLVGAPAGAGVFRDNRAWHGATPNLSRQVRSMPNVEYAPHWMAQQREFAKTMPHEIWEILSPHAQQISRLLKAESGVWPAGAGVMHPLTSKRKAAKGAGPQKAGPQN